MICTLRLYFLMMAKLSTMFLFFYLLLILCKSSRLSQIKENPYELISFDLTNVENNLIEFNAFGHTFTIELNHNTDLYSSEHGVHLVKYNKVNETNTNHKNILFPTKCYYHGKVKQDKSSLVSLSKCDDRGIRAHIIAFNGIYIIKPSKYYFNKTHDNKYGYNLSEEHLIYKHSNSDSSKYESHRQLLGIPSDNILEMLIINDKKRVEAYQSEYATDKWQNELISGTLEVINFVNNVYLSTVWDASVGTISLVVKDIYIWTDYSNVQPVSYSGDASGIEADSTEYVLDLTDWLHVNIPNSMYDNTALLTGEDLDGSVGGRAHGASICKGSQSCSVTQHEFLNEYGTGYVLAHELGHNFGMDHSCAGIMNGVDSLEDPYFSDCSKNQLLEFFTQNNVSCLENYNGANYYPAAQCDFSLSGLNTIIYPNGLPYTDINGDYRYIDEFNGYPYYKHSKEIYLYYDVVDVEWIISYAVDDTALASCNKADLSQCIVGNWVYFNVAGYDVDTDATMIACTTSPPTATTTSSPTSTTESTSAPSFSPTKTTSAPTSSTMAPSSSPTKTTTSPTATATTCMSTDNIIFRDFDLIVDYWDINGEYTYEQEYDAKPAYKISKTSPTDFDVWLWAGSNYYLTPTLGDYSEIYGRCELDPDIYSITDCNGNWLIYTTGWVTDSDANVTECTDITIVTSTPTTTTSSPTASTSAPSPTTTSGCMDIDSVILNDFDLIVYYYDINGEYSYEQEYNAKAAYKISKTAPISFDVWLWSGSNYYLTPNLGDHTTSIYGYCDLDPDIYSITECDGNWLIYTTDWITDYDSNVIGCNDIQITTTSVQTTPIGTTQNPSTSPLTTSTIIDTTISISSTASSTTSTTKSFAGSSQRYTHSFFYMCCVFALSVFLI
eukprot:95506_1